MKRLVPILYANCIMVNGHSKCIICDLQRSSYVYIPNDLYNILTFHKGKTIEEIKKINEHKYDDIIDEYFNLLITNEFVFLTDTPELFLELSMNWNEPFQITNAIVDIGKTPSYNVEHVLEDLSKIKCKFIQFRIYKKIQLLELESILKILERIKSNSIGVEFCISYNESFTETSIENLFQNYRRLNAIVFFSSKKKQGVQVIKNSVKRYILHLKANLVSEKTCGVISKGFFAINIKTFTESQKFNSCLNRKISVDVNGEIKNCPSMPKSFGNINITPLQEVLARKDFKKYWDITKDQIDICKDCEFRYICTDCRAYTERNHIDNEGLDLSKPLKCGYNPYTNEWAEWSRNPLKQKSIEYYKMQDLVKKDV